MAQPKANKNKLDLDLNMDFGDGTESEAEEEEIEDGGESDDEGVNDAAHEKLLNSIFAMDGKKRNQNDVRGISLPSGNLDSAVHAKKEEGKIKPEDLKLKARDTTGNLMKPMSSMETELAKRKVARDSMNAEMTTWEPVVQEIRSAPQMIFSKRPHGVEMYNAMKPKAFTPRTPLEKELFAALGQSEDILHPKKELTKSEEKALKAMSIQEAMERRAELLKHNELLSRAQIRAKRIGKIKSKRYRKIMRKEREGAEKKELEKLRTTDPEAFVEKMEQLEKDRMEERLTLKHRGGGKFARLHKVYSKFDDKTRDAMQDMLQKSRELTKKTANVSSSDDDDEEAEADNDMEISTGHQEVVDNEANPSEESRTRTTRLEMLKAINKKAGGWLDGPKSTFLYVDGKASTKASDLEEQEQPSEEPSSDVGHEQSKSASESKIGERINSESSPLKADSSHSQEVPTESAASSRAGKRKAAEDDDEEEADDKAEEDAVPEPKKKKRKRNKKKKIVEEEGKESAAPKQKPVVETTLAVPDLKSGDNEGDEEEDGDDDAMKVTMEELFQDEDVVEEFAREKAAAEERSRPKVEDLTLPGWGSWAGPDYKNKEKPLTKKQKRALARAEQLQKQQKKIQQPHVWFNENKDEAIRKLQPKTVPFPYTSVQQYEASLRQPVSRGFVTETAYKLLNKPEVVTKMGHIIKPLDKEDVFRQKSARDEGAMGPVKPVGGISKKMGGVKNSVGDKGKGKDSVVNGSGKVSANNAGVSSGKKDKQRRRGIS